MQLCMVKLKRVGQVLKNHQISLPYEDWDAVVWITTSSNSFLDGSTLMSYADDSIAFQASLLPQMAVAVGFLMVAVEDLEPSNSHDKQFCSQRSSLKKDAYFRYNRTDREIENPM